MQSGTNVTVLEATKPPCQWWGFACGDGVIVNNDTDKSRFWGLELCATLTDGGAIFDLGGLLGSAVDSVGPCTACS